jgi:hypothetical protein
MKPTAESPEEPTDPSWVAGSQEKASTEEVHRVTRTPGDAITALPKVEPKTTGLTAMLEVGDFLVQLRRLHREGCQYKAGDLVFDFFEERFERGGDAIAVCDLALWATAHPARLSDTILVALLAVTLPMKNHLPSRADFLRRVHASLTVTNGPEEADTIAQAYR